MFKTVFAADIGSKCIKCVARGQVATEETAIALEAGAKLTVAAAGNAALLHRSGVIRPVRDGAAANTRMLAMLLGRLACEKTGKRTTASIELHAAIPHMLPTVKQNALKQAARLAGFRALQVHDPLLMGAIGADADLFSDRAHMIVNIGAETMTCAAFANGGMLWQGFSNEGSAAVDRAIQNWFRDEHRLLIGERMAEIIKQNLNKLSFDIEGRSADDGLPQTVRANGAELRAAAQRGQTALIRFVKDAVKALQPEAAADLLDTGITLIGGGALQFGLAECFSRELPKIPILTAKNAVTAVADGMNAVIFKKESRVTAFKKLFTEIGAARSAATAAEASV